MEMKDLYVGIKDIPVLGHVKMGHFKQPFSIEELTSSKYITFIERSLPVTCGFVPGREVGIAATRHSDCPGWWIGYGAHFDSIDEKQWERQLDRQGIGLAGRFVWLPVYANEGRDLLHLGIAGRWVDDLNQRVRFRSRPETHEGPRWIDTGNLDNVDSYGVLGLEGAWVRGPFSIQSELMYCDVGTPDPADSLVGNFYGAYVYGSFFLTGEHRRYKLSSSAFDRVKPLENFWIVNTPEGNCIGTGAWELTARWSYLDMSGTFDDESGVQNNWTLGVNWYWNPYARMMLNYIQARNTYSNGDPQATTDMLVMRWQVDF
jgi:phosphate-selective porin OprO/OprP